MAMDPTQTHLYGLLQFDAVLVVHNNAQRPCVEHLLQADPLAGHLPEDAVQALYAPLAPADELADQS